MQNNNERREWEKGQGREKTLRKLINGEFRKGTKLKQLLKKRKKEMKFMGKR